MVRAGEPTGARRLAIDLALAIGWPLSEVQGLTLWEAYYVIGKIDERRRRRPPMRVRRGSRR
jgi:hypothetical protein